MRRLNPKFSKFIWFPDDVKKTKKKISRISLSSVVLEFYNKCNSNTDGKFCDTAGGNEKGKSVAERSKDSRASKKILSSEKNGVVKVKPGTSIPVVNSGSKPKPAATKPKPKTKPEPDNVARGGRGGGGGDTSTKKVTVDAKVAAKSEAVSAKAKPKKTEEEEDEFSNAPAYMKGKPLGDVTVSTETINKDIKKMFGNTDADVPMVFKKNELDDTPHGYVEYSNGVGYTLKKGETIADAFKALKDPKNAETLDAPFKLDKSLWDEDTSDSGGGGGSSAYKAEETRVQKVMKDRAARTADDGTVADYDIAGGLMNGMNNTPPPTGVKPSTLTDDDLTALFEYRGEGHFAINSTLRSKPGFKEATPAVESLIAELDAVFAKAPVTTQDMIVYRGVRKAMPFNFKDDAYTSTTYDKDVTQDFGGITLAIRIPKGTPVLKLSGNHAETKRFGGEAEILLPRGGSYDRGADGVYTYTGG